MAGFLTSASASLTTGTKLITISGNVDCSFVVSGTAVYLNNILMEGVAGTAPDPSGNSTITLRNNYTGTSIINGTLVAFNTIEGLRDAIQRARELAATQEANNSQLDTFLTNTTTSVDLELPSGTVTVSPYQYISGLVLGNDVKQYAMSQAQFEAIRAQNKERYAASGWVSFGNHESGKQVNECKTGLYTSLTTPNTLLIGKTGGVGGSKTDHASVHIDGIVFNLTNQFVLTLPSHPTSILPERMDMYGIEAEKVEISAASPNAYQGGLRGVGAAVNLFTATDQQKKDFFSANANTTYIGTDGKIYQWQLYKVSFAGATDGVPSPTEQGYTLNSLGDIWIKAGKNLLYFGNVMRLNDGGYHPSFNPLGAAKFVGDTFWYNTATSITSKADCFNPAKLLAGSGSITSGKSGRPEIGGRYYDAVYADGYGGVCRDMRYSAYSNTLEDFAEADRRVKNGTYRGFEKAVFTKILVSAQAANITPLFELTLTLQTTATVSVGDTGYIFDINNVPVLVKVKEITSLTAVTLIRPNGGSFTSLINTSFIHERKLSTSFGGSFLQTDVIGHPLNILATSALANGWQGSWGGIPSGGGVSKNGTRKMIATGLLTFTPNNGLLWSIGNLPEPNVNNIVTSTYGENEIRICQYQAFGLQTESAVNTVINGMHSYYMYASMEYRKDFGVLLGESLIGKVASNQAELSVIAVSRDSMISICLDENGKLYGGGSDNSIGVNKHIPISLSSSLSSAFKAFINKVKINKQAFIQYSYTELKNNGTTWGDDGKVTIVDNQATKTDLNGNTVLVGTAKLKEPIGWIKNKV